MSDERVTHDQLHRIGVCVCKTGEENLARRAAPAETAQPSKHPIQRTSAGEMTPKQFAVDICRELYDRFMMGGWQPEEAHDYVRDILNAHAKQRVEQAERRNDEQRRYIEQCHTAHAKLRDEVADLERERDTLQHNYDYLEAQYFGQTLKDAAEIGELKDCYEAAAEKLKEMREALRKGEG